MEIERKFLISKVPNLENIEKKEITQGYISAKPEIRIRKCEEKCYITKKSVGTLEREELETEINNTTYEILKSIVKGRIIHKTRYLIKDEQKLLELDLYHKELEGLCTVEIEFSSIEEANDYKVPSWFGEEITENINYKNRILSKVEENI